MKFQRFNQSASFFITLLLFSALKVSSQSTSSQPGNRMPVSHRQTFNMGDTSKIRSRIFGFNFFAPLNNHISVTYEKAYGNQISLSAEAGIIGIGLIPDGRSEAGFFVKAGPKLYFSPDFMMNGMYRYNDMQGAYIKPQIILNYYSAVDDESTSNTASRSNYIPVALMLNFGKQWVVANTMSLDISAGIGYGAGGSSNGNQYSHAGGFSGVPITFSSGLVIGFLAK